MARLAKSPDRMRDISSKAEKTREAILSAAVEEFALLGPDGARIDSIAGRAGVNKERIYAYFKSKDNLFAAALKRVYGILVEEDKPLLALTEIDAPRLTDLLLERYFAFHQNHPEFRRILSWENLKKTDRETSIHGLRRETFENLKKIYRHGQGQGIFPRNVSGETYLFTVSAVTYFYFSNRKTMSETLGLDLFSDDAVMMIKNELVLLLSP